MTFFLQAAVAAGHALNYLRLASLDQAMNGAPGGRGLRWNSQYLLLGIYMQTPLRFKLGGRRVLSAHLNVETARSERKRPEI